MYHLSHKNATNIIKSSSKLGRVISLAILFTILIIVPTLVVVQTGPCQAAVVEGDGIEREVDSPTGIKKVDSIEEANEVMQVDPSRSVSGNNRPNSAASRPDANKSQQPQVVNTDELPSEPLITDDIPMETPKESGGMLKYIIVGLIVAGLGIGAVLYAARSQEN